MAGDGMAARDAEGRPSVRTMGPHWPPAQAICKTASGVTRDHTPMVIFCRQVETFQS